jgi:S-formylglutathione hydrolase FrmB
MTKAWVAGVLAVAAGCTAAIVEAQGGGGRGGRGAGAGAPAVTGAGTVERITVHGKSLEGNLEGDSPDRDVTVYLPPSYASDPNRRFPVVYLLHGYGGREDTFTARLASLQESGDRLAVAQGFSSAIVVTPSAFTLHKGSMYSNSPTTGDWERFIAEDLVAHMDKNYRTLPSRLSRGLAGHSMGGYGALKIGMKRPDVFGALYIMSACCLAANRNPRPETMAAAEAIKTREQAEEAAKAPGFGPSTTLASAAAWSPNPKNPPLFLDLPVRDGKVRPDVIAKWVANSPMEMLARQVLLDWHRDRDEGLAAAIESGAACGNDEAARPALLRGVRRRPHEQGPRADRAARSTVLRKEPGRPGESDQSADPALVTWCAHPTAMAQHDRQTAERLRKSLSMALSVQHEL